VKSRGVLRPTDPLRESGVLASVYGEAELSKEVKGRERLFANQAAIAIENTENECKSMREVAEEIILADEMRR